MNVEDTPAVADAVTTIPVGINEPDGNLSSWMKTGVPNPFSDKTSVEFYLASNMKVKLELTDLLGKNTQLVFEGNLSKGLHQSKINAAGLGNGIYILKLTTREKIYTQKLIVLKN